MSDDNIPFEIQTEIIKTLPVKSLLRFRSVSKTWKFLIDSSNFISQYSHQQTQHHHLLVRYNDNIYNFEGTYVSIVDDDDKFPQHNVSISLPPSVAFHDIIGSSHGLLCLHSEDRHDDIPATDTVVLWNISIRKGVSFVVPNVGDDVYTTALGFGVCRVTRDLKIVKIRYILRWEDAVSINYIPWQVEVFSLSTRAWRTLNNNLPCKSVYFGCYHVAVDGFVYWLAVDRIDEFRSRNLIISFDVTTEEFKEVNLPNYLAHQPQYNLSISKLRESVVVLQRVLCGNNQVFGLWAMEDGVSNSFRKLFNVVIKTPNASVKGFRNSGAPIIEYAEEEYERAQLFVYDPCSKSLDDVGVDGIEGSFSVYPYVETLLLLDQPDLTDKV